MKSSPTLPQELPLTSQHLRSLAHHPFTIRTFRHLLRFSFPFLSPFYPHSEQDFWALSSPRPFVGTLSPSRLSMTTSLSSLHLPLLMFSTVFIPRNNLHVISSTGPWILSLSSWMTLQHNSLLSGPQPSVQQFSTSPYQLSSFLSRFSPNAPSAVYATIDSSTSLHQNYWSSVSPITIQDSIPLAGRPYLPFQLSIHTLSHHPSLIPVAS